VATNGGYIVPTKMCLLHNWYMEQSKEGREMFAAPVHDSDFFRGEDDLWIEFESLWFFNNQDAVDKS
jgi:hypothetical protein